MATPQQAPDYSVAGPGKVLNESSTVCEESAITLTIVQPIDAGPDLSPTTAGKQRNLSDGQTEHSGNAQAS